MRMTEQEIAAVVHRELTQARGYGSDFLATRRATALDLYNGRIAAAPEGRSQAVSGDVADAIHATLAQVSPVVRSSQIEFEAQSQEDEQQAQTESDFVRVNIERSSGFDVIDSATFDALLEGNGWLHAYVDETTAVTEQRFPPNLPDEAVFACSGSAVTSAFSGSPLSSPMICWSSSSTGMSGGWVAVFNSGIDTFLCFGYYVQLIQ